MLRDMPQLGGVRLAPLPASTLPSSMEVRAPVADSEYGDEWADPVTIGHVRFSQASEFGVQGNNAVENGYVFQDGSIGLVYVDAVNSAGAFEVPAQSEITIDGGEVMEVVKTTRQDNLDGTCHHWEIEVR